MSELFPLNYLRRILSQAGSGGNRPGGTLLRLLNLVLFPLFCGGSHSFPIVALARRSRYLPAVLTNARYTASVSLPVRVHEN